MDVSPQAIREVQFRERLRGYHPDDVDDYLARVALAVEALEQRLRESSATPPPPTQEAAEIEESLRRTLLLAQRTADLAVQEAREEAARLVAEAEASRQEILAETEQLRRHMTAEADSAARVEIQRLHDLRARLQADVAVLQQYLESERERLRRSLTDQLRRLEEGELSPAPPPQLHELEPSPPPSAVGDAGELSEEPYEEPTGAMWLANGLDSDDDQEEEDRFMAELRRAATDDEPLGPRETGSSQGRPDDIDIFDEAGDRSRFGSRLRRRR